MNRRTFLQTLTGAVAAVASGLPQKAKEEVRYSEPRAQEYRMPDGFEVVENAQPMDADYLAFVVRKWRNGEIVARKTHQIYLRGKNDEARVTEFRERIMETIEELKAA